MFKKSIKIALILVYLVIIAGAVVRMTGSGMGCPDWPKCFGYYIPPTQQSQLEWHENHAYKKGQVIIVDESLKVANSDFSSTSTYDANNWSAYTKHDYAIFNPVHTWVEYINRLAGALAGIAVFIMALLSFTQWNKKRRVVYLSWLTVFLMGFQAWLGAEVVYSVLLPVKITIHMIVALLIVAVILYILFSVSSTEKKHSYQSQFKNILVLSAVFTLIQVILGTEVRQFIDEQVKTLGYEKSLWMNNPNTAFYIHRTFSSLILLINLYLWFQNRKLALGYSLLNWVLVLIGFEILTGISMYYLDFPYGTQPLHLVIAAVLFGIQFYLLLQCFSARNHVKKTTFVS